METLFTFFYIFDGSFEKNQGFFLLSCMVKRPQNVL